MGPKGASIKIAAPMFSRLANFDDADPLRLAAGVDFQWVPPGQAIPRDVDVVILFGTKSTIGDLAFMREQKWDQDILAHHRAGGRVLGICGGYQILGRSIFDPYGHDGVPGTADGLELLDVETAMTGEKRVSPVTASSSTADSAVPGYEIHVGHSFGPDTARPFFNIEGRPDGASSPDGRVQGTYMHGLFSDDTFRKAWLQSIREDFESHLAYENSVETALDDLADALEASLDISAILAIAQEPRFTL